MQDDYVWMVESFGSRSSSIPVKRVLEKKDVVINQLTALSRRESLYGIYAALIFASGVAALSIQYGRTGSYFSELAGPIDKCQALLQIVLFGLVSVLSFLVAITGKPRQIYLIGLRSVLAWYLVFEVWVLCWVKEPSLGRSLGAAIYIVLPTAYVMYATVKNGRNR